MSNAELLNPAELIFKLQNDQQALAAKLESIERDATGRALFVSREQRQAIHQFFQKWPQVSTTRLCKKLDLESIKGNVVNWRRGKSINTARRINKPRVSAEQLRYAREMIELSLPLTKIAPIVGCNYQQLINALKRTDEQDQ